MKTPTPTDLMARTVCADLGVDLVVLMTQRGNATPVLAVSHTGASDSPDPHTLLKHAKAFEFMAHILRLRAGATSVN